MDSAQTLNSVERTTSRRHSGVLGLGSIVRAYPHEMQPDAAKALLEVAKHLNDPSPIPVSSALSFARGVQKMCFLVSVRGGPLWYLISQSIGNRTYLFLLLDYSYNAPFMGQ